MATRKITNQKFQHLRRYLFPGVGWNDSPPDIVSPSLVVVMDSEWWVPIPRYMAFPSSPAAGAGIFSAVALENFVRQPAATGGLPTARATRFVITNLRARLRSSAALGAQFTTRTQLDGGLTVPYAEMATKAAALASTVVFSGWGAPFAQLLTGNLPTLAGMPVDSAGDTFTWHDLPDIEPGNGITFTATIANQNFLVELAWAERRLEGEENV